MRVPSYRRHSSGNARVTINGKDHLLGKYDSPSSHEKYKRLVAEYKASQRSKAFGLKGPIMRDVMLAYIRYVKEYYKGTTQPYRYKAALRPVKELYRTLPAREFGPRQFKAVRADWLEDKSRSRRYINEQMQIVARMVEWAVAEELLEPDQLIKIRAVKPLERGHTTAREPAKVECVPAELVEATLPLLTKVQADMVRFQLLTGCRPGELVSICPGMVDRSGEIWLICLAKHKTAHKGKQRTIYIGPKAQAVLAPYLLRAPGKACFSPKESEQQRRRARHAARVTPMSCGCTPGSKQLGRKPRVEPGEAYTSGSYRENVALLERRVSDARKWISLDQGDLQDALSCSLELLGMSPLQRSIANQDKDADEPERFEFPNLDSRIGGDPSWATTLDTLRPSPDNGVKNWKWRKDAPVRPVIFDAPKGIDDSVVQLHLQHRVVQRLLSRFTAQGFVLHDLSRACLAHSKDDIPRVVLIGRLSIYGIRFMSKSMTTAMYRSGLSRTALRLRLKRRWACC